MWYAQDIAGKWKLRKLKIRYTVIKIMTEIRCILIFKLIKTNISHSE